MHFPSEIPVLRLNRSVPARLQAFAQVRVLIDQFAMGTGLGREDRHKLTLIVEELFVNTVNHGFGGDSDTLVSITIEDDTNYVSLTYEDCAPAFDPLAAGMGGDPVASINERNVGGLGLFLALGLTQHADYSYAEGRNRLCLQFVPKRP